MSCAQPLLIHANGTGSCSMPGCLDQDTLMEAVRRHRYVVNCRSVLGTRCAVCHGSGTDDAGMCPGLATVHADLSVECSVSDCEANRSRDGWLARHGDVRSCADIHGGCALCSVIAGDASASV
jgi:hypothetical protein